MSESGAILQSKMELWVTVAPSNSKKWNFPWHGARMVSECPWRGARYYHLFLHQITNISKYFYVLWILIYKIIARSASGALAYGASSASGQESIFFAGTVPTNNLFLNFFLQGLSRLIISTSIFFLFAVTVATNNLFLIFFSGTVPTNNLFLNFFCL